MAESECEEIPMVRPSSSHSWPLMYFVCRKSQSAASRRVPAPQTSHVGMRLSLAGMRISGIGEGGPGGAGAGALGAVTVNTGGTSGYLQCSYRVNVRTRSLV